MAKQSENTLKNLLGAIMTSNVNISDEEYKQMLDSVALNYDKVNGKKKRTALPTIEERRERVRQNYYGNTINFLYQIFSVVNDLYLKEEKNRLVLNEIAKKLGIEVDEIKTADEKAMEAVERYYAERAKNAKQENK